MKDNGIERVKSFASDIKTFDLASAAPKISMCLLDVDLYQPVKVGLAKVLPLLSPGGVVVVDDMIESTTFDGARQAYRDFARETGRSEERSSFGSSGSFAGLVSRVRDSPTSFVRPSRRDRPEE